MKKLPLWLGLGLALAACQKESESTKPASKTDLLTARAWRLTSYTSVRGSNTTDVYATFPSCQRDDRYLFNANGTLTQDEGPTKCGSAQTVGVSPWTWNGDQTKISFGFAGMGSAMKAYTVATLTADVMQLSYSSTSGGVTTTETIGFVN